jgi:drug/metabolite transporter (DMT)-like permease
LGCSLTTLSRDIWGKYLDGLIGGFLLGIGVMFLIIDYFSQELLSRQIIQYYDYIGFGAIILGIVTIAYAIATVPRIVERVNDEWYKHEEELSSQKKSSQ